MRPRVQPDDEIVAKSRDVRLEGCVELSYGAAQSSSIIEDSAI